MSMFFVFESKSITLQGEINISYNSIARQPKKKIKITSKS